MLVLNVNWLAVVVATVASIAVGFLWYGPIFGKKWVKLSKITPAMMKAAQKKMKAIYAAMIASELVKVTALAVILSALAARDVAGASIVAGTLWLGFVATTQFSGVLWEGRKLELFSLNTIESLIELLVAAIIIAVLA